MDEAQFRRAMGKFTTGVTVVATEDAGEVYGMTANAFMSVSLDPKLVTVSVGDKSRTLSKIVRSKIFSINVLSASQQELSRIFASCQKSEHRVDFDRLDQKPVLPGAIAQIACELVAEHVVGDHVLLIGEVTDIFTKEDDPLIFYDGMYHSLKDKVMVK